MPETPVIDLSKAPGRTGDLRQSRLRMAAWLIVEVLFVSSSVQVSSRLRAWALRRFGATIGDGVILRPRLRVKSPWFLEIGDRSWIGEGVWFDNHDRVTVGSDVVISQEAFLTTGAHAYRKDMALVTRPIVIEDGAWISSRCFVLGGAHVGRSAVASPMSVVKGRISANTVIAPGPAVVVGQRFAEDVPE